MRICIFRRDKTFNGALVVQRLGRELQHRDHPHQWDTDHWGGWGPESGEYTGHCYYKGWEWSLQVENGQRAGTDGESGSGGNSEKWLIILCNGLSIFVDDVLGGNFRNMGVGRKQDIYTARATWLHVKYWLLRRVDLLIRTRKTSTERWGMRWVLSQGLGKYTQALS